MSGEGERVTMKFNLNFKSRGLLPPLSRSPFLSKEGFAAARQYTIKCNNYTFQSKACEKEYEQNARTPFVFRQANLLYGMHPYEVLSVLARVDKKMPTPICLNLLIDNFRVGRLIFITYYLLPFTYYFQKNPAILGKSEEVRGKNPALRRSVRKTVNV